MEQKVQLLSLVPTEVLFSGLPKRRESRRSRKSPAHHPPTNVIVDKGVPQEVTGRFGV
jgi:hypothetical protein